MSAFDKIFCSVVATVFIVGITLGATVGADTQITTAAILLFSSIWFCVIYLIWKY